MKRQYVAHRGCLHRTKRDLRWLRLDTHAQTAGLSLFCELETLPSSCVSQDTLLRPRGRVGLQAETSRLRASVRMYDLAICGPSFSEAPKRARAGCRQVSSCASEQRAVAARPLFQRPSMDAETQ